MDLSTRFKPAETPRLTEELALNNGNSGLRCVAGDVLYLVLARLINDSGNQQDCSNGG
jgi:hypothetical protein